MRDDVIESVLIGASAALLALAVHTWADGTAPYMQLGALVLAGIAIVVFQLILSVRRRRRRRPPEQMHVPPPADSRQNLFFRELNSDWLGLDDPPPARDDSLDEPDPQETLAEPPTRQRPPEP